MKLSLILCLIVPLSAFVTTIGSRRLLRPRCKVTIRPEDDLHRIEEARQNFELLLQDHVNRSNQKSITSTARRRRTLEISLLESLRDSDDAIEELVHLWITERSPESATAIMAMETECSDGLFREEKLLRTMMQDHVTWAEPVIRLATLCYFKGRTDEAYEYALDAFELKPWHFEIPQLLIMISLRNQDMGQAVFWARRSLPPFQGGSKSSGRRRRWVDNAVAAAKKQLQDAERLREDTSTLFVSNQISFDASEAWE